jgi:glyoxylase I family protein
MPTFRVHHTAISVRDVDRSVAFYEYFGFRTVFTWSANDGSLSIVHMQTGRGEILELLRYTDHITGEPLSVGNDLARVGVKHLALAVDDLQAVYDDIVTQNLGEVTDIIRGRTLIDLFFVRDPDGLWVEVLHDERSLDPTNPVVIEEAPRLLEGE